MADILDWFIGIWPSAVDEGISHLQVMDFASVLMCFLLVCGGSGVFPLYLADKYWPSLHSPTGVQYNAALAERLQHCFLLYGMVQANVGIKLVKSNILGDFLMSDEEFLMVLLLWQCIIETNHLNNNMLV